VTKKKATKPKRSRKPKSIHGASTDPLAPPPPSPRLAWNSPEAWSSVEDNTRKASSDWQYIATNTPESPSYLTARRRAQILGAVCAGDATCLRALASLAAKHMARQGGYTIGRSGLHDPLRSQSLEKWHGLVMSYLQPSWALDVDPKISDHDWARAKATARRAISTEEIARHMLSLSRSLPGVREMVALYNRELFPMASLSVPVPEATMAKIVTTLEDARYVGDVADAAEKMIVRFLIAVGVPEKRARAVWDYRKKSVKRKK
jgi:hypothetical protein